MSTPNPRPLYDEGLYYDMSEDDYRVAQGVSVTTLHKIAVSPMHYKNEREHPKPATAALHFGRAMHAIILEPHTFYQKFRPDPFPGSQTKEAKKAREDAEADGWTIIQTSRDGDGYWDRDDWAALHNMREAVMADPIIGTLMATGSPEVSAFWTDPLVKRRCKARIDWYNDDHQVGLEFKSAAEASYSQFQRDVRDRRYFVQDAYFCDGMAAVGHRLRALIFVVLEKGPPYATACYKLDDWRREGRILYQRDLKTYAECSRTDTWPGYPSDIRDLQMPPYAKMHPVS